MKQILQIALLSIILIGCVSNKNRCEKKIQALKNKCPEFFDSVKIQIRIDTILVGDSSEGFSQKNKLLIDSIVNLYSDSILSVLHGEPDTIIREKRVIEYKTKLINKFIKSNICIAGVIRDSTAFSTIKIWEENGVIKWKMSDKNIHFTVEKEKKIGKQIVISKNKFYEDLWFWLFLFVVILLFYVIRNGSSK